MPAAGTIILPIAGRSSRFPGVRPKWMLTAPTGELMLELSLRSIPRWQEHRVVIGGLREHLVDLQGEGSIRRALGEAPDLVVFDDQTSGPAETVAEMLRRARVDGPIFVKDCDSWFQTAETVFDDVVCFVDLRVARNVRNIPGKSFVKLNENNLVAGIVEKSVSSNYISVGGYGFHEAASYLQAYDILAGQPQAAELFVSHVILESIHRGAVFRGIGVGGYEDVGTLEAWVRFRMRQGLYLVDLDGVVFRNAGQYTQPLWDEPDVPLMNNVETIRRLAAEGAQIVFMTARPERYREKTERALRELDLTWHSAIFGLNHSSRTLINDFAPSNPFPSANAVNVVRNDDHLDQFLRQTD